MTKNADSTSDTLFWIDSCALITFWRDHYPEHVFPGLWIALGQAVKVGQIKILKCVFREVESPDRLRYWLTGLKRHLKDDDKDPQIVDYVERIAGFLRNERDKLLAAIPAQDVVTWRRRRANIEKALRDFSNGADIRLVAAGAAHGGAIVSYERKGATVFESHRIVLPMVANHFGVAYKSPIDMFADLGFKF